MKQGELRARRNALEAFWRQGLKGRDLLEQHTQLIDTYIRHYHEKCPVELRSRIALVALGGYGRSEQFPFSDVDILLLHEPDVTDQLNVITETIFYPLWDAGLEVGHGVRTVEACLDDANEDFFFQVALLDARFLCGNEQLFTNLEKQYRQGFVEGQRRSFLENMITTRQQRQQRFGMHSYLLEPHIKESRGGLRDIHAMLWTAKALFGLSTLEDLQESGLLTNQERLDFTKAWDHLVRTRNRLHYLSSRKNDQLYFEYQEEMANDLQFRNSKELLGVEQFMRDLYGHLQKVAIATDLFFEHVEESLALATSPTQAQKLSKHGIIIRHGHLHLELDDPEQLQSKPYIIMQLFSEAAENGLPIHYRTKKLVTANLHLIDDRARVSKRMAKAFLNALNQAKEPLPVLTTMLETGLLAAYIPELGKIASLAQHDVYHIYTVDRHLLQTVTEMAILRDKEASVFTTVTSPHILFLAALLHDIGKGQGGNHSELGAEQAATIGKRMGLADDDIADLCYLIQNHLFLTDTALRRDLEDEPFLIRCAHKINEQKRLSMLYLLSIADARATGPTAWNDWKAALLLELYQRLTNLLGHADLAATQEQHLGVDWMRSRITTMIESSHPQAITETLNQLPGDYLVSFSPDEVVEHLVMHQQLKGKKALLAATDNGDNTWTVIIMSKDRPGLLSKICGILALYNLTVLSAQIWTWPDNTAVDVITVLPQQEDTFLNQDWTNLADDLNRALANRLALAHRLVDKRSSTKSRMAVRPEPRVQINNVTSDRYTVIEVFSDDHPGLLYDITRCLAELDINIYQARIATEKERLVDVFYVLDSEGNKIEDAPFHKEISKALLHVADNNR